MSPELLATPQNYFDSTLRCQEIEAHSINLLGIDYDGAVSFRSGAKDAPDAIRNVSMELETYSPYIDRETLDYRIFDLGNLKHGNTWEQLLENFNCLAGPLSLEKNNIKFVTLGGDHSISYAPLALYLKQYPELVIVHLDAHSDLREEYLGNPFSHASVIRRALDHFSPRHQLIQYGIRSGTKEEFSWMRDNKTLYGDNFYSAIADLPANRPIYLTLDLDYFDPAYLPGTGTPEAGGNDFQSLINLLQILKNKNFVGADVVELAPGLDSSNNSAIFACKVVREIMLTLTSQGNTRND